jgi:hypothetical protein
VSWANGIANVPFAPIMVSRRSRLSDIAVGTGEPDLLDNLLGISRLRGRARPNHGRERAAMLIDRKRVIRMENVLVQIGVVEADLLLDAVPNDR